MKEVTAKRVKLIIRILLTAFSACLSAICAVMTKRAFDNLAVNRYNVQERLYEAVDTFYGYLQFLVFFITLLGLTGFELRKIVCPGRPARRFTGFVRQRGLPLMLSFSALFVVLLLLDRATLGRIAGTVETSEVPAALSDHKRSGKLEIGAELSFEAAVITMISWMRSKKGQKHE